MSKSNKRYVMIITGFVFAVLLGLASSGTDMFRSYVAGSLNSNIGELEHISDETEFSICFLDVGQADAAIIECEGHFMLVDGGNAADSSKLYAFLRDRDIKYIDMVVASHAHEDHVGGLAGALNYAAAGIILGPTTEYETDEFKAFKKYADINGGIQIPKVGDAYKLGSAVIDILGVNAVEGDNDSSIILKITYGDTAFVFMGDAERKAEEAVLEAEVNLKADVLKVGHHGSEYSTIYPFLREVMPKYAVISVGADNAYGHPTELVLSRLDDVGAIVYRTDYHGDIWCYSDGKQVRFVTEENDKQSIASNQESDNVIISENTKNEELIYILNVKSKKFHYPECGSVLKMSEKNKSEYIGKRQDILEMGYVSCGICNP